MVHHHVHVSHNTLEVLRIVALNVPSTLTARRIRHALTKDVPIPARVRAA